MDKGMAIAGDRLPILSCHCKETARKLLRSACQSRWVGGTKVYLQNAKLNELSDPTVAKSQEFSLQLAEFRN